MKKTTIWIIAILMGASFFTLLFMQMYYYQQMMDMRKEQFDVSVNRSLFRTVRQIEDNEIEEALQRIILKNDSATQSEVHNITKKDTTKFLAPEPLISLKSKRGDNDLRLKQPIPLSPHLKQSLIREETSSILKSQLSQQYLRYKSLVNQTVYHMLYESSELAIEDRIDFKEVDRMLAYYLHSNGVKIPYHIRITTYNDRELYRCKDYDPKGEEDIYTQVIFHNEAPDHMAIVQIHFPDIRTYIFSSIHSAFPAMLLTLGLLVMFCITIWLIIRQGRMSVMRTDFINNMTHEFKTPLSTLSLAAQMLNDPSVSKSEGMIKHITGIINDETKRLRFQVEKVLQISMFEKQGETFKRKDFDIHEVINDVVTTFRLKVESMGGEIITQLDAKNTMLYADEMHITNVLFNLLDNAIKYHRQDVKPQLEIYTHNHNNRICIHIKDNGIGIKREDLKKIFEKFFRVHTGNRHDVKGFGLGLCYVKSVIQNHKGSIHAESTLGEGTTFFIELPIKTDKK